MNLDYNQILLAGGHEGGPPSELVHKKLQIYNGSWEGILKFNGPVEDPSACYLLAQTFAKVRNYRQSAQLLDRISALNPENVSARIALASIFVQSGRPDDALAKIAEIRAAFPNLTIEQQIILTECEAWS